MDLSDLKRQLSLSKRSDNPELNIYTSLEFQALGVEVEKMTEDIIYISVPEKSEIVSEVTHKPLAGDELAKMFKQMVFGEQKNIIVKSKIRPGTIQTKENHDTLFNSLLSALESNGVLDLIKDKNLLN